MKTIKTTFVLMTIALVLSSCASKKTINGVTYRPYGIFNESTCKNDSIQYSASGSAIVCGVIFFECFIPPIYIFGYNLWEPVGLKKEYDKGTIKGVVK